MNLLVFHVIPVPILSLHQWHGSISLGRCLRKQRVDEFETKDTCMHTREAGTCKVGPPHVALTRLADRMDGLPNAPTPKESTSATIERWASGVSWGRRSRPWTGTILSTTGVELRDVEDSEWRLQIFSGPRLGMASLAGCTPLPAIFRNRRDCSYWKS